MKQTIQQRVVPRHRSSLVGVRSWHRSFPSRSPVYLGRFDGAQRKRRFRAPRDRFHSQRGSVDHTTVTVTFGLIALLLVGMLGFFYLQQVVSTASQGTDIHGLEAQLVDLKEKQRQLELEGAQLRSLQVVEDRIDKLNLVATDQVSYLVPTPDRVALQTREAGGVSVAQ